MLKFKTDSQFAINLRTFWPNKTIQNDTKRYKRLLREIGQTRVVVEGTRTRYQDHRPQYLRIHLKPHERQSWTAKTRWDPTCPIQQLRRSYPYPQRQEAHSWTSLNSSCWRQWDRLGHRLRRAAWIAHQLLSLPQGRRSDTLMIHLGVSITGGTPVHHPFEWDFP